MDESFINIENDNNDLDKTFDQKEHINLSRKILPKLDKSTVLFYNCPILTGGRGTKFDSTNNTVEYARIDGVGGPGYFTRK